LLRQPVRTVICAALLTLAGAAPMIAVGWAAADIQGFTASTVVTVHGTTAQTFPNAELGTAPTPAKTAGTATQPAAPQPAQPQPVGPPKQNQPTGDPGTPATGRPSATRTKSPTATATETKTAEPTATDTATTPPPDEPDTEPSS
jgi:hypothetical protein